MRGRSAFLAVAFSCLVAAAATAGPGAAIPIPTGDAAAQWKPQPATGVGLTVSADAGTAGAGRALRMDFDFHGGGGYAVAHRAVSLDLPAHWRFRFHVRGACGPQNLEFKLVDASGDNVWWSNQRDLEFTTEGRWMTLKQRHVTFAWGPAGGGEIRHVAAIEFAVTAGSGGKGTVWIEGLEVQPLPAPDTTAHAVRASATSGAATAALAVDGSAATAWAGEPRDAAPALTLDLGAVREFSGLTLDWLPGRHARDYDVALSIDGRAWQPGYAARGANGGRDWIELPESEARYVRVAVKRAADPVRGVALAEAVVRPLEWAATRNAFWAAVAGDAPRGSYPRATAGEDIFWTVVGVDGAREASLVDEVGRVEPRRGGCSLEPFLRADGRLWTWADAQVADTLVDGYLPIPRVTWTAGARRLQVTAFAAGAASSPGLVVRYALTNLGATRARDTLYLALRPFQVNPPTQFLGRPGGAADIREIGESDRIVKVNGAPVVFTLDAPAGFGASAFDQGEVVEFLRAGTLPPASRMPDPSGRGSGALAYAFDLPPGATREIAVLLPLGAQLAPGINADSAAVYRFTDRLWVAARTGWHARTDRVHVALPDTQTVFALKAQLAYALVNRSGPALQPGARAYARAWIRDGAMAAAALLRLGETDVVREFVEWFAAKQYANGKVPCCADARGADPVPENDSHGELVFAIADYVRHTGDRAFAEKLWPNVAAAIAYMDTLRAERSTPEWSTGEAARFHGLLTPSISHEGYSAKPMHSYWDDLWGLRGYSDAAWLAALLGRPERAAIERERDRFAHDIGASIRATMAAKGVAYVPGCADLGDFDPTSTSIALNPANTPDSVVSRTALEATYARYWDFFSRRASGAERWVDFTPYEWRNVGAMTRLGWRDRADSAATWLMQFRRPIGFQHWAEVVQPDPRAPRFLGDMPHSWVGTDFLRTTLDRLAYEDESDSSIVIGAGVPAAWLADSGVVVRGLRTRWGALNFTMRRQGRETVVQLDRTDLRVPPGGIRVVDPADATFDVLRSSFVRSRTTRTAPGSVVTAALPARLVYANAPRRD